MIPQTPFDLFSQFVELLVALLAHPSTPKIARQIFKDAATDIADQLGGYQFTGQELRVALLRGFALHLGKSPLSPLALVAKEQCNVLTPDRPLTDWLDDNPESQAFYEIAQAMATIERHREYLPPDFYACFGECLEQWVSLTQWDSEPELLEQILPLILRYMTTDKPVAAQRKSKRLAA